MLVVCCIFVYESCICLLIIITVVFVSIAECRIRGSLMFELHAVMAEDARRSQHDTNAVMEALLVSFRVRLGVCRKRSLYNK